MTEAAEQKVLDISSITWSDRIITAGNKEIRFGTTPEDMPLAVKIWKDRNGNGGPMEEFEALSRLKKTALAPFTPKPLGLVKNGMGEIMALALEPKEGEILTVLENVNKRRLPDKATFDRLEQAVLAAADQGVFLDYKMLAPGNLGFDRKGLWFVSGGLRGEPRDYKKEINNSINYLRQHFYC